jgi:hypothetical protein
MKKFKLNYVAFSLIMAMTASCVNEEALSNADQANAEVNNEFTFDKDIHNYEINGKLVYNRNEIAVAAVNAWNVYYDYHNKKVSISTTPKEFEKLINADAELKAISEKESETGNDVDEDLLSTNETFASKVIPYDETPINSNDKNELYSNKAAPYINLDFLAYSNSNDRDDNNDVVLHTVITKVTDGHIVYLNTDLKNNTGTNLVVTTGFVSSNNLGHTVSRNLPAWAFMPPTGFAPGTESNGTHRYRKVLVNHDHKKGKLVEFFEKPNYQGRRNWIRMTKNMRVRETVLSSWAIPNGRKFFASLKVTNI